MGDTGIPYGYCHCGCGQQTRIAEKNNTQNGIVKGRPFRYMRGHSTRKTGAYYKVEDRGYETPCWVWQLTKIGEYGFIRREGRMQMAHRYFYAQRYGQLPDGHAVEIHHRCETKACVNPDHLEPITALAHGRHHTSSATAELVAEIRRRYVPYKVTRRMLAEEYGLSLRQVTRIVLEQSWR